MLAQGWYQRRRSLWGWGRIGGGLQMNQWEPLHLISKRNYWHIYLQSDRGELTNPNVTTIQQFLGSKQAKIASKIMKQLQTHLLTRMLFMNSNIMSCFRIVRTVVRDVLYNSKGHRCGLHSGVAFQFLFQLFLLTNCVLTFKKIWFFFWSTTLDDLPLEGALFRKQSNEWIQ